MIYREREEKRREEKRYIERGREKEIRYIYISYLSIYLYILSILSIYIYIYIEGERERKRYIVIVDDKFWGKLEFFKRGKRRFFSHSGHVIKRTVYKRAHLWQNLFTRSYIQRAILAGVRNRSANSRRHGVVKTRVPNITVRNRLRWQK